VRILAKPIAKEENAAEHGYEGGKCCQSGYVTRARDPRWPNRQYTLSKWKMPIYIDDCLKVVTAGRTTKREHE
jgi:hypothetical protein